MLHRIVQIVVILPIALLLIAFSIANRDLVTVSLDPFGGGAGALSLTLPLFLLLFAFLLAGVLVGGSAAWIKQAKWRRQARQEHREAERWRHRAEEAARQPATQGRSVVPAYPREDG